MVGSESSNAGSLHRQLVKELREMASFFVATWRMRMELYGVRVLKRWLNASVFYSAPIAGDGGWHLVGFSPIGATYRRQWH
jgi:hypothetical protein